MEKEITQAPLINKLNAVVTIRNGVAEVAVLSPGVLLTICDYDVDGADPEFITTDKLGDPCIIMDYDRDYYDPEGGQANA